MLNYQGSADFRRQKPCSQEISLAQMLSKYTTRLEPSLRRSMHLLIGVQKTGNLNFLSECKNGCKMDECGGECNYSMLLIERPANRTDPTDRWVHRALISHNLNACHQLITVSKLQCSPIYVFQKISLIDPSLQRHREACKAFESLHIVDEVSPLARQRELSGCALVVRRGFFWNFHVTVRQLPVQRGP